MGPQTLVLHPPSASGSPTEIRQCRVWVVVALGKSTWKRQVGFALPACPGGLGMLLRWGFHRRFWHSSSQRPHHQNLMACAVGGRPSSLALCPRHWKYCPECFATVFALSARHCLPITPCYGCLSAKWPICLGSVREIIILHMSE